jgi:hypothetical protein
LPTTSSADLLLNNVQVDFATAIQIFGTTSAEVSRIGHMFGRNYQNNYATEFMKHGEFHILVFLTTSN